MTLTGTVLVTRWPIRVLTLSSSRPEHVCQLHPFWSMVLAVSWLWSEARGLAYGIPLIFEVFSENIYIDLRTITTARISLSQSLHHTTPQVFKSHCKTSFKYPCAVQFTTVLRTHLWLTVSTNITYWNIFWKKSVLIGKCFRWQLKCFILQVLYIALG